jgi:hypothetical protein
MLTMAEGRQAGEGEAALAEVLQRGGDARHTLEAGMRALDLVHQHQGGGGGAQAAAHAVEQGDAQHLFQARDVAADGGLRGVQGLCRARHLAGADHGAEHVHLPVREFHRASAADLMAYQD